MRSGTPVLVVLLILLVGGAVGAYLLLAPEPPPSMPDAARESGGSADAAAGAEPPPPVVAGVETAVTGRVVRFGAGTPVAGASVRLAGASGTSGEDGRFSFDSVVSGPAAIEVVAEGFEPIRRDVVVDASAPDLGDLELASPTVLVGRVLDEDGAGLAGARVRILERDVVETASWSGPAEGQIRMGVAILDHGRPPPGLRLSTDSDGAFRVEGLSPGSYFLAAHAPERSSATAEATVPPGDEAEATITLGPGSTIEGVVDDPTSAVAVEGATVIAVDERSAWRLPYEPFLETRSGADGGFRIEGARAGDTYAVFARAPDGKIGFGIRVAAPREGLRLVVGARGDVHGTVVDDETGQPVEDVRVFGILGHARSDADGAYRLDGFIRNPFLRQVWFEADGYERHREEIGFAAAALGGNSLRVDVRLKREKPGSVAATVVDLAGRPVAGATVEVRESRDGGALLASGVTDASGRLTLEAVPPGYVHVRAAKEALVQVLTRDHPREGPLAHFGYPVFTRIRPGQRSEARIELARTGSVRGAVRDARGRPLAGVEIFGVEELGETGEDGRFEVTGVPRDLPSYLGFRAAGYLSGRELARPGVRLEVVLRRGRSIAGVVVDERDEPVGGVQVRAYDTETNGAEGEAAVTGPDGSFRLEGIGADEAVVRAQRRDRPPATSSAVRLAEGETREGVRIRMVKGVRVTLAFADAGGRETGASYLLYGPLEAPTAERVSRGGRSRTDREPARHQVVPGRYRILATPDADVPGGALEIERELVEDVDLTLAFSGEVRRIRLRAPADSGLLGATFSRTDPSLPPLRRWFAPDPETGLVETGALPPGRYQAAAYFRHDSEESYHVVTIEGLEPGGGITDVRPPGD